MTRLMRRSHVRTVWRVLADPRSDTEDFVEVWQGRAHEAFLLARRRGIRRDRGQSRRDRGARLQVGPAQPPGVHRRVRGDPAFDLALRQASRATQGEVMSHDETDALCAADRDMRARAAARDDMSRAARSHSLEVAYREGYMAGHARGFERGRAAVRAFSAAFEGMDLDAMAREVCGPFNERRALR